MIYEIQRTYTFEAAHWLPLVGPDHKCANLHGHTYRITIQIKSGKLDQGMVLDFDRVDEQVKPLIGFLDHSLLNDAIANPTAEEIAEWFVRKLAGLAGLWAVRVQETDRGAAVVYV